jgi:aryl-alcohol dehydrogenase-like predicted oxidoreductase
MVSVVGSAGTTSAGGSGSTRPGPSSTPPTSTATGAGARPCSGRLSSNGGSRSSSPPSSGATWAPSTARTTDRGDLGGTSAWAIEGSLRRLQTDHVDLYQYHFFDGVTPLEETLAALDELVREGKVRSVGSSNLAAWQVADADWMARDRHLTRFVSAQNHYSLLERDAERELLPACQRFGIGVLPYFPLASGLLTGKYHRGQPPPKGTRLEGRDDVFTDRTFDRIEALEKFAADRGVSLLDVAIGGLAAKPAVASVIAGATKPGQVRQNAAAAEWVPTKEDLEALDQAVA